MEARALRSVRTRHDDPDIPADVEPRDLDKVARNELKTLNKENAEAVARHLVMAARLIDEDPELAHRHAISASRRAGRIAVVRETVAITAYSIGDYAMALRELRTHRRLSGSNEQLALIIDSERGLGRPDKALEEGRAIDRSTLSPTAQVATAIAMSGARLDLEDVEGALRELEIPQLDPNIAYSWSPDLFHAYAEVLEELGREDEAERWRERAETAERALTGEDDTVDVFEEEIDGTAGPDEDVESDEDR
jgi:tetratricopeptide (TPR) repeat protein